MKKRKKSKSLPARKLAGRLDADTILHFATGLTRDQFDRQIRRRDLIRFMLTQGGPLHITRRLSRGLGLRRRALRAEIDGWINSPGPWKGHIHWAGRNRLLADASAGPQMLDLDGGQLALVFAALKLAQDNAVSSTRQEHLSLLRNRLIHALPVPQRQLLALTHPPEAPGLEGAEPATLAAVLAAIKGWNRLHLRYSVANGAVSDRTVWPIILHYADTCLIAWCELRNEQRSFRLDRMIEATVLPDAPPRARADLLADWDKTRWQD